jgi:hypothetical protein
MPIRPKHYANSTGIVADFERRRATQIGETRAALSRIRDDAVASMKVEAPWTDRTGNARRTLHGALREGANYFIVSLSHGVFYGVFLEKCNEQRFAIVDPTLPTVKDNIMDAIRRIW